MLGFTAACLALSPALAASPSDTAAPAIIGGTEAPSGAWPFVVALEKSSTSNNYQGQFCGGTLVKANYVVTAAHCVFDDYFFQTIPTGWIKVLAKTQDLSKGGTRYSVAKISVNPNYNPFTHDYDVAVIKLSSSVIGVTPAKLVTTSQSGLTAPGVNQYTVGWGNTSKIDDNYPIKLRQVQVPIISNATCNKSTSYNGHISDRMICAGFTNGTKDSCQGDSGGPLLAKSGSSYNTLVGVVSWGQGCAMKNYPGVYSRLGYSSINSWINGIISQ
ncbi:S1 family peptidase [Oryzibacter oryziterrae]|uniref:S1 family peptidase n=1 Tax=Oryzibacter oryziterrae TaxID=2766474 RepID=UPI001F38D067|nr:serine protease [Oryzibacter oryziterrae]